MEKGYHRCVYVMLRFKKEVGVDIKEEQVYVEDYPDEEEMDNVNLDAKRKLHWIWCSRPVMEGWTMQRHCYMLRGEIYM